MEWRRRDSELGRSAVKEPCRRGEEKPPFVDGFSDFLTGLQDLFWQSESHMGRATTSNLLLASPTTSLCACPSPPTSAVAENLEKIPSRIRQPQLTIIFWFTLGKPRWLSATTSRQKLQITADYKQRPSPVQVLTADRRKTPHKSRWYHYRRPPWFYLPSGDQEFLAFAWPRCHSRCCCRSRHSASVAPMTEYVEPASCRVYSCCLLPAPPQPWPSSSLRPSIRNCWLRPSWIYQRQADPVPNSSLVQLLSDPNWPEAGLIQYLFNSGMI